MPLSPGPTDELLALAQAGDRKALDELLRRHRATVYRYGLRVCRTTEDAEDAVQETLWAATRFIRQFRGASTVTTWLFTIVRNKCHRLLRQHKHDEPDLADALPAFVEPPRTAEEAASANQVRRILAVALAGLEPQQREVLLLRDALGLTAPEAAERLGLSVAALKSRLHRARQQLREQVVAVQRTRSIP
jgi:RNA polymerase sigma-70 factor (ECF subfamily)